MKTKPHDDEVIAFIFDTFKERGYPPSVREIGRRFGWSSSATTHARLKRLVGAGRIARLGVGLHASFVPPAGTWRVVIDEPVSYRNEDGVDVTFVHA